MFCRKAMLPFGSHQAPLYRGSRQNRLKGLSSNGCELGQRGSCLKHPDKASRLKARGGIPSLKFTGAPTTDTSDIKPNTCRGFLQCTEVSKVKGGRQVGVSRFLPMYGSHRTHVHVEVSPNVRKSANLKERERWICRGFPQRERWMCRGFSQGPTK